MSCLFCKIISGEVPSQKIYEDDFSYAFLDISPVNVGHTLLISKEHHENIYDMPDELLAKLSRNIKKLANAVKSGVNADGINVGINNDAPAGQVIFHSHIHIIPRFENDGHKHWSGRGGYGEGEAEKVASDISKII